VDGPPRLPERPAGRGIDYSINLQGFSARSSAAGSNGPARPRPSRLRFISVPRWFAANRFARQKSSSQTGVNRLQSPLRILSL